MGAACQLGAMSRRFLKSSASVPRKEHLCKTITSCQVVLREQDRSAVASGTWSSAAESFTGYQCFCHLHPARGILDWRCICIGVGALIQLMQALRRCNVLVSIIVIRVFARRTPMTQRRRASSSICRTTTPGVPSQLAILCVACMPFT